MVEWKRRKNSKFPISIVCQRSVVFRPYLSLKYKYKYDLKDHICFGAYFQFSRDIFIIKGV